MILLFLFALCFQNILSFPALSTRDPPDPRTTQIGTPCSNDTSQAWLDIVLVVDSSQYMTTQKMKSLSNGLSSIFSKFNIGQEGNHKTRVGIITYASDVVIHYNLTDFSSTDQLLQTLNKLPSYVNLNDAGAHITNALQTAFQLLPTKKTSHVPVIVLIGANYDHDGFEGLERVAKTILADGVDIMTISFAAAESPLTKIFSKISSYSYISTQANLYDSVSYAFAQINCICPMNTQQFVIYNSTWKNYTKYADCIFGNPTNTLASLANFLCDPGVLVSTTSTPKTDFIIDRIVPEYFKGMKKFTIGLHKSSDDGIWKWWGYNGTEYPAVQPSNPAPNDTFGYLWNSKGFNWEMKTMEDISQPFVCQSQACDASYICDMTSY